MDYFKNWRHAVVYKISAESAGTEQNFPNIAPARQACISIKGENDTKALGKNDTLSVMMLQSVKTTAKLCISV